ALVRAYDPHLTDLCRKGVEELPAYQQTFDLNIVHSDFTRQELQNLGFGNIHKLPLVVDTSRFTGSEDQVLSSWLSKLSYLLFVGRIVPQKDILAMLGIFKHFRELEPDAVLVLVGGRHLAPSYQREISRYVRRHQLAERVLFTEQINSTELLTSLYKHAKFTLVTSEWESFCVPIVESMRFGTPLVVHNIPPLPEVMGKAGIIIDKTKPENAAGVIHDLWNCEAGYAELVQRCSEQAAAFTESTLASQLFLLFESVFPDA
ncbi:MAG: glycosyltransferase, partial [Anaerolineae bacterium]|nr:glycosyltransferase [Anaerolineae bacterium]